MLTRLDLRGAAGDLRSLPRPAAADEPPVEQVREIIERVRAGGDAALRELTARFDGVDLARPSVPAEALAAALESLDGRLRDALHAAHEAIDAYHRAQLHEGAVHERGGLVVRELRRPVDRAGVYVPGGAVPLLSTVLMTAVPAAVAGVPEVVLCTPPGPGGPPPAGILAAAAIAGVHEVYAVNGPAGIAAMAYGTESIRPVDVIVGPGNVYVAQAKREVAGAGRVAVPSSFAGPSEVVVVADATTPVELAAIDLVVQIEHGPDGLAWLVTWDEEVADRVEEVVRKLAAESPRREVVEANLEANSYTAVVDGPARAVEVANAIAPEHLELMCDDAESLLPLVRHAGAVFCGPWSPASVGDYVAGPSHVLPTYGSARFAGALRVDDFLKHIHVVTLDRGALRRVAPHVVAIAEAEGLPAHAASVRMRER